MKKFVFVMSVLLTINLYAKPRAELIREDLTKLGVSNEIIEKTIELNKIAPNLLSVPQHDDEAVKYLEYLTKDIEELLEKDEKNFVLREDLINLYNRLEKNKDIKLKNIQLYEKYAPHEVVRLFHSLRAYLSINDTEKYLENYNKLKEKYPDSLLTIIAVTYHIGLDRITDIMKNDEKAALATINKIISNCDNEEKRLESNISEEEAWAYKLSIGTFAINAYLRLGKVQEAIDFYYNNFTKKEASVNIKEYFKYQQMNIQFHLFQANKRKFENTDKKIFDENRKKINFI